MKHSRLDRIWRWIQELRVVGEKPVMVVLENPPEARLGEREKHWIAKLLGSGEPLLNKSVGGGGIHRKDGGKRPPRHRSVDLRRLVADDLIGEWEEQFDRQIALWSIEWALGSKEYEWLVAASSAGLRKLGAVDSKRFADDRQRLGGAVMAGLISLRP